MVHSVLMGSQLSLTRGWTAAGLARLADTGLTKDRVRGKTGTGPAGHRERSRRRGYSLADVYAGPQVQLHCPRLDKTGVEAAAGEVMVLVCI